MYTLGVIMRYALPLLLVACLNETEKSSETEGPPVEIDWGSWEINTTFIQQDDICTDFSASGENLGILYGEMDVGEPSQISMTLGDQDLSGERSDHGFKMTSFRSIPVNGAEADEYGIGAVLNATVHDLHSFTGKLVYQLDFPAGYCNIESEVDAYWMYYEPPPSCGG